MNLKSGTLITQNVRLVSPLNEGAMGSIWIAEHIKTRRRLAVKFVTTKRAKDRALLKRFKREAEAASKIESPHVVKIYGFGKLTDGSPYMVMELLIGETLGARLERDSVLSLEDTAVVLSQVAKALDAAHAKGVIHRDIKPDNIFIVGQDDFPLVKVLDFGMAKETRVRNDSIVTATGVTVGTPEYMSPEQVLGSKDVDHRSDFWALGVVAYRCIAGVIPFQGTTPHSLFFSICRGDFAPLVESSVPEHFSAWFRKALAPNKEKRFDSAEEMCAEFERAIAQVGADAERRNEMGEAATAVFELPPELMAARSAGDHDEMGSASERGAAREAMRSSGVEFGSMSGTTTLSDDDDDDDDDVMPTQEFRPEKAAALLQQARAALEEQKNSESRVDPSDSDAEGATSESAGAQPAASGPLLPDLYPPAERDADASSPPEAFSGALAAAGELAAASGEERVSGSLPPVGALEPGRISEHDAAEGDVAVHELDGTLKSRATARGSARAVPRRAFSRQFLMSAALAVVVGVVLAFLLRESGVSIGATAPTATSGRATISPSVAAPSGTPITAPRAAAVASAPAAAPREGILKLRCEPACSTVMRKGSVVDVSPDGISLPPGSHVLRLLGTRGVQRTITVEIRPGETTERTVFMPLPRKPAPVFVPDEL